MENALGDTHSKKQQARAITRRVLSRLFAQQTA